MPNYYGKLYIGMQYYCYIEIVSVFYSTQGNSDKNMKHQKTITKCTLLNLSSSFKFLAVFHLTHVISKGIDSTEQT